MKGSKANYNELFTLEQSQKNRKGRSVEFDKQRNECLLYRYSFFALESGFRYEILIRIISMDFWLSEVTVINIMRLHHSTLTKAKKEKLTRAQLKKKWPQINWELPNLKDYGL